MILSSGSGRARRAMGSNDFFAPAGGGGEGVGVHGDGGSTSWYKGTGASVFGPATGEAWVETARAARARNILSNKSCILSVD